MADKNIYTPLGVKRVDADDTRLELDMEIHADQAKVPVYVDVPDVPPVSHPNGGPKPLSVQELDARLGKWADMLAEAQEQLDQATKKIEHCLSAINYWEKRKRELQETTDETR